MEKSVFDGNKLVLSMDIASKIGLNEAIVLQQINYWMEIFEKKKQKDHQHNFRWWVFNTYDGWKEQFPFWSVSTIKRTFWLLEKSGILLSGEFNKYASNHTKWYTIDYDRLTEVLENPDEFKMNQSNGSKCTNRIVQIEPNKDRDYAFTYPHKTSKVNTSSYDERQKKIHSRVINACNFNNIDTERTEYIVDDVFYYFWYFRKEMGRYHPVLQQNAFNTTIYTVIASSVDDFCYPNEWKSRVKAYFNRNIPKCDRHISHFVSDGIQDILSYDLM